MDSRRGANAEDLTPRATRKRVPGLRQAERRSNTMRPALQARIIVPPDVHRRMVARAREFRRVPTPSERLLWAALRDRQVYGLKFRRQHAIGPFAVDFFCAAHRLIVEVDGPIHDSQREHDAERQRLLEACGYSMLRFSAAQVEYALPSITLAITMCIQQAPSPSPSSGEGAGG